MSDTTAAQTQPPETPHGEDPTQAPEEKPRLSIRAALSGLAQGELGSVRVILGIALVWVIFQSQNDNFLTATNLTNLLLQVTAVGTISVGIVLILLLGEIDLSVGSVSGLCAAIMAVLNVKHGWAPVPAILAAVLAGAAVGLFQGFFVNFFQIPSFVVTLAGLIGWQGLQLQVLGETGTVNLPDNLITDLTGTFFADSVGWILAIAAVAAYIGSGLWKRRRRAAAELTVEDPLVFWGRSVLVAAAAIAAVYVLNSDRGLPLAAVILVGLVALFAFITTRTRFGRHIYAVGGNAEAARRAGIKVARVRMTVFILASTLAAVGGILAASRLLAVNQSSGGSDLLLLAIAGPVVAGVSLFGGRGTVWAALLGAILIGSISNGMDLLGLSSPVKFMITGAVLLAAVTIDSATRLRRQPVRRA
jgi:D-xylose transport system permease protein